jgi:acyl transferase domain-containing protein
MNPLYVTSLKANVGHLEAASGAAGLAKTLLMLKHQKIPPQISLWDSEVNPRLGNLERHGIIIPTRTVSWSGVSSKPRLALVNNFGAAGSNAAVLVQEFVSCHTRRLDGRIPVIFGISAKTPQALEDLKRKYCEWFSTADCKGKRFEDIVYTATARRRTYEYRIAVVASNVQELRERLEPAASTRVILDKQAKVVFAFSGQGGQYLKMGRMMYETSQHFRQIVDECHRWLEAEGFPGVLGIILSDGTSTGLSHLEEIQAYQSAVFVLQCAMASLWVEWGVKPDSVIGHR